MTRLLLAIAITAAGLSGASAGAFQVAHPILLLEAQPARMVCDEWGRCWDQPEYGYARPRYRYGYGNAYGEYEQPRPPTKWERKGFCPPGQHKKGNC